MLRTHLTNEKKLNKLAREIEGLAKSHGLKSQVSFQLMSDPDFDPKSEYLKLMGYSMFRREVILWVEELERYDKIILENAEQALATLPAEERDDSDLKDTLLVELLLPATARALAHEIKHQIDDHRHPWLFRVSNFWACLWKHPWFLGSSLEKPLLLLYRFSPIEMAANRYARKYAEDYQQILRRYLRATPD